MAGFGEFQVVNRRNRKKNAQNLMSSASVPRCTKDDHDIFDTTVFKKRLKDCMQEVKLSEFFQHVNDIIQNLLLSFEALELFTPAAKINDSSVENHTTQSQPCVTNKVSGCGLLSYGIGHFSSCPIARYQLAFLLVLREKIKNPPCLVYDPVFSTQEIKVLEDLECRVIPHNEEGKHVCQSPTLLFMPHCGKALYNNLIWANLATLGNLIIIGNSFSRMLESTPQRHLMKTANYVIKVAPYVTETPLKSSSFVHSDVFNDLAVHIFSKSKLSTAPAEFWEGNSEPEYSEEEAEIIRKEGCQDEIT